MAFNSSEGIHQPLPTCGTKNNCLIDEIEYDSRKVITQDGVVFALDIHKMNGNWQKAVETDDEFTEPEKRAVTRCVQCHLDGLCDISFVDEVEVE